jgi:hypothetical protein
MVEPLCAKKPIETGLILNFKILEVVITVSYV